MSAIRLSRNFKVPVVYSNTNAKVKTVYRWDPASKRLIPVQCISCPAAPAPPPPINNNIFKYQGTLSSDPGNGNFYISGIFPNNVVHLSTTDLDGDNVTTWLSTQLAFATTITLTKNGDPSVFLIANRLSSTNNGTYWSFGLLITSFGGVGGLGDDFIITYT
jgi:hypothetical protein